MEIGTIITLCVLGVSVVSGLIAIIVAIVRGDMKKFIVEKMEEAEKSGKSGKEKLAYVLEAVKEKYKVMDFILNVKKFVEYIISISKNINAK